MRFVLFTIVGMGLLVWGIWGLACRPPYSETLKGYVAQQEAAERRAEAYKENGKWTPTAIRAFAKGMKSGEVIPQRALAEMGIVILEDLNTSTVRQVLEAEAGWVENCGGKK